MVEKKSYYEIRKDKGLCTACGIQLPEGHPTVLCTRCAELQNNYQKNKLSEHKYRRRSTARHDKLKGNKKRYLKQKSLGICVFCGEKNDRLPKVYCSACALMLKNKRALTPESRVEYYNSQKETGDCINCHGPIEANSPSVVRCISCAKKARLRLAKSNVKAPTCKECGYMLRGEDVGEKYCSICRGLLNIERKVAVVDKKTTAYKGVENMGETISNEFTRGFEVGRRLGGENVYNEFIELINEVVVDSIEVDELKNILRLVRV